MSEESVLSLARELNARGVDFVARTREINIRGVDFLAEN